MKVPKLTVITVCLNSAETIERSIESVLAQDDPNLEYIIFDGGSTDGTTEIIRRYEKYLSFWKSEPDTGIYNAMNKGIHVSTGDLIGFLSSNDWYAMDAFKVIREGYAESAGDVIYGDAVHIWNGHAYFQDNRYADINEFYSCMPVVHPAMFVKGDLQRDRLFDESYITAADYHFFLQAFQEKRRFYYHPGTVINYNQDGVSYDSVLTAKEVRRAAYEVIGGDKKLLIKYTDAIETNYYLSVMFCDIERLKNSGYATRWLRDRYGGRTIYFFGAGYILDRIGKLFFDAGLSIGGIFDNSVRKQGLKLHDHTVMGPKEMDCVESGSVILITTRKDVDHLANQIGEAIRGNDVVLENYSSVLASMEKNYIESGEREEME